MSQSVELEIDFRGSDKDDDDSTIEKRGLLAGWLARSSSFLFLSSENRKYGRKMTIRIRTYDEYQAFDA